MSEHDDVLRTLVAVSRAKSADFGIPSFVPEMARSEGFEPPTPRFEVWCSIQLSYERTSPSLAKRPPEAK